MTRQEAKRRPFKTKDECWQEMHKHPNFGWVMTKSGEYLNITEVSIGGIRFTPFDLGDGHSMPEVYDFMQAFSFYTFTDGEPFGIKE